MSNFRNNYNSPPAGVKRLNPTQSTALCLKSPQRDPETPQKIKHFRKSFKEQPGVPIRHYGLANDEVPNKNVGYGFPKKKSEGIENIVNAHNKEGVGRMLEEIRQSKYQSAQKFPVGRTVDRKYQMPRQAKSGEFKFGLPNKREYGVKQTIFSGQNLYYKDRNGKVSARDDDPGMQKNRSYNWNVDPNNFKFGKVYPSPPHQQINRAISPQYSSKANIVSANFQNYIQKNDNKIRRSNNERQKQFPPEKTCGRGLRNEWSAGECIRGTTTKYNGMQNDDVGKCNKKGVRNVIKDGDEERYFGVPSVRHDLKKPEKVKISDPNNYPDEKNAVELIFPEEFATKGIEEDDFNTPFRKQEIYEVFKNIGVELPLKRFEVIFERAKVIEGTVLDKVSCNSFKSALTEMQS